MYDSSMKVDFVGALSTIVMIGFPLGSPGFWETPNQRVYKTPNTKKNKIDHFSRRFVNLKLDETFQNKGGKKNELGFYFKAFRRSIHLKEIILKTFRAI